MTTISVLASAEGTEYRAVADGVEATGDTPGQALDALVQRAGPPGAALVVLQPRAGDEFFTDAQRKRLGELMDRWRAGRDGGAALSPAEQAELDALVQDELKAATARAGAALRALRP